LFKLGVIFLASSSKNPFASQVTAESKIMVVGMALWNLTPTELLGLLHWKEGHYAADEPLF